MDPDPTPDPDPDPGDGDGLLGGFSTTLALVVTLFILVIGTTVAQ